MSRDSIVGASRTLSCGGRIQGADIQFEIPADRSKDFFGGAGGVVRLRSTPSFGISIPAQRWREGKIGGHPAAIADPILPNGLGQSAVLVYADGILTVVQAMGFPIDLVISIAEEQLK